MSGAERNAGSGAGTPGARVSATVAEALQCDSRGQHERALTLLADACRQGDVEAMTQLGQRLLTADRAPYVPEEGTQLVIQAANLGGGEAAAQVAVLAAIGIHINQSWQTAMAAIVFAAECGWPAAQGQLRVLAGDRELAAQGLGTHRVDRTFWRKLADTIDLNRWHTPSASGATLSESPLVRHVPGLASTEICQWLIERARGRLVPALVYDAFAGKEQVSPERSNTWAQFNVTQSDLVSVLVQVQMCANVGAPFRQIEPMAVLHYSAGEQSTEHYDFVDPQTPHYEQELASKGQRVVTFLLYLNDDYEHGETELVHLGIAHKGRRGEGLFFVNALANGAPDMRTLHAGRPPTRGEKWVVSQFIRDRPTF